MDPLILDISPVSNLSSRQRRIITMASILTAISTAIIVIVEILAIATATVWAISGLLHTSQTTTIVLATAVGIPALILSVILSRQAFNSETDPENH